MPRPHKKRKGGDDESDEDEWKPSSHSVMKAVRRPRCGPARRDRPLGRHH